MKQSKKTFFIASTTALFVLLTVFVFGHRTLAQESQVSTESSLTGGSSGAADQILSLLQELNSIQLDDSIFTDPMFLDLKDYHVDLAEEPKQRINPFAPIGEDAVIIETQGTQVSVPEAQKPAL